MWKSRTITITLLTVLTLTACCVVTPGCRGRPAPDHTWYDASGNRVEERYKTDANGHRVLDDQGRPIPDPHVPYDRYHRPWVYSGGVWAPLPPPAGSSSSSRSTLWLWGGSGYRSTTNSPSYRAVGGGSSGGGGSSIGSSSGSGSSISRGGIGSTGMSSGGGSS